MTFRIRKNHTKVIRGIDPSELYYYSNVIEEALLKKFPSINEARTRYVSICGNEKISDNKIVEYLHNDILIASIYEKRNDFNTVDLYVSVYIS